MDVEAANPVAGNVPVIAIVGGIGSGKSLVAREFASHAGYLIQADDLGHDALRDPEIKERIVSQWGNEILDGEGNISRRKLGQIVFTASEERRRLEGIVFPFIKKRMEQEKERARHKAGVGFIVLDAAILLEAGWTEDVTHTVFVDTPREIRLERLSRTREWNEAELQRREQAQMPLEQKKQRADAVIVNDAGLDAIQEQVRQLLKQWKLG